MTDEQSLIDLVLSHHTEPLPRLIYADWLDDRGDPLSAHKSVVLRTWCRLRDTPLTDLDGYTELAQAVERARLELPAEWFARVGGTLFHIGTADMAYVRADAFLRRLLPEGDYELRNPRWDDLGWVVPFVMSPVAVSPGPAAGREKEHKRGGSRRPKRPLVASRHEQNLVYRAATPLFVDWRTARVGWHRGPLTRT